MNDGTGKDDGRDEKNKDGLSDHDGPPGRIAVYCCLALHIAHGFVEAARKQYGDGEHDDGGLYKHSCVPSVWLIFSFTFPPWREGDYK